MIYIRPEPMLDTTIGMIVEKMYPFIYKFDLSLLSFDGKLVMSFIEANFNEEDLYLTHYYLRFKKEEDRNLFKLFLTSSLEGVINNII